MAQIRVGVGTQTSAKFAIVGDVDQKILIIKADDAQTENILEVQDSGGNADIFTVDGSENTIVYNKLTSSGGRVVNTTRLTSNTTLDATHHNVFCNTDGGAFTVTLPAGVDGTYYRIVNTGSSSNAVTITPDGSETILGDNSSITLSDGDVVILIYETTEGWW